MKKKLKFILPTILLSSSILLLSSCGNQNKTLNLYLSYRVNDKISEQDFNLFINSWNTKLNQLNKESNIENYNFKIIFNDESNIKSNALKNGSADFAILPLSEVFNQQNKNTLIKYADPLIQTLTDAFVFDTHENDVYIDGNFINDPLIKIAKEMQNQSFSKQNYNLWNDKDFLWNGIRYDIFYQKDNNNNYQLTNHYRGMIVLCGDDNQINIAKKAWENKDWNTFRNLGIIHGNENSDGNFKLQELLLKKHFNNKDNTFTTLLEDKKNHQDKYEYDEYGIKLIGKTNKVISFTDEASFAWTHNKIESGYKSQNETNKKIEILTVTDPGYYDVGFFSKKINKVLQQNFVDSFIETTRLYKQFGDSYGYNGFVKINNFQTEVVDKYYKTFGS